MPFKPGGGHLPQPYDPKNGEYIDKTTDQILDSELIRIKKLLIDGSYFVGYEPHWPTLDIHDDEYCKLFVQAYRHRFNPQEVVIDKVNYLLTWDKEDDKSQFLIDLGYSKENPKQLQDDLIKCARFEYSIYNKNTEYGLKIYVPVKLKNKKVVSVWMFENANKRKLKFLTLKPKKKAFERLFGKDEQFFENWW